jgi:hypothetical protein
LKQSIAFEPIYSLSETDECCSEPDRLCREKCHAADCGGHALSNRCRPGTKEASPAPRFNERLPNRPRENPVNIKHGAVFGVLALFGVATTSVSAQHGGHRIVTPESLTWQDVPALPPGAKIAVIEGNMNQEGVITARIKLPPNYVIPPHYHPAVERVVVISGTVNIGMGDKFDKSNATQDAPLRLDRRRNDLSA